MEDKDIRIAVLEQQIEEKDAKMKALYGLLDDRLVRINELKEEIRQLKKYDSAQRKGLKDSRETEKRYQNRIEYLEKKIERAIDVLNGELIYPED